MTGRGRPVSVPARVLTGDSGSGTLDTEADVPDRRTAGNESATAEQRWVLALASVASFLVILDMLVVAIALTAIRRHLGSSSS
jgi:hypothetical protein